jgi:23S rRNA (guanine2445-N2)-methyltransferase / 23S rRNA (guanine2069-N7)-methyltransferase
LLALAISYLEGSRLFLIADYGERLGWDPDLPRLYATLGDALRRAFPGWRAAVFTQNAGLAHRLRAVPEQTLVLYNGALRCRLYCFDIVVQAPATPAEWTGAATSAEMFANRLAKNMESLARWARRAGVDCYSVLRPNEEMNS